MYILHHLCLSIGKWLFEGGGGIIPINQSQGRDDAGCLPHRLLFKSGLSQGVSTLHRVECKFEFSGSARFCACFSFPCIQPREGV